MGRQDQRDWWCAFQTYAVDRLAALVTVSARGAPTDPIDFFKTRVRPFWRITATPATGNKMGGLQLDSLEHVLKGGNSGPAVLPGNPDQSLLIRAVSHTHDKLKMPRRGS